MLCKHMEAGSGTRIKEFYVNLKDRKNLTCYVRGKWLPFGERTPFTVIQTQRRGKLSRN